MTVRAAEPQVIAGLHTSIWPGSGPVVVGLAGLTSTGAAMAPLAAAVPRAHVVAPDLRGRGGSQLLSGPPGLRAHAQDVAALLRELDLGDVVLVGHSMGAYLAPLVAQEAPERIHRLVLIDGGIRPRQPPFMRPALVRAMFRRQLRGMDRDWPNLDAVARKGDFTTMLASRPDLQPAVMRMLHEELGGGDPPFRPRIAVEHAVADAVDTFFGPDVEPALDELQVPADVLLAANRKRDGQRPFISDRAAQQWQRRQPLLSVQRLAGNHVTVLFAPEVAAAVTA
ncbi:MAG TPA: alpha/beta hydrolase [Mycobacteriales bacterium]|nr:alpha/beta hydrolase [Mycobacteriales bacterium]